ncbi:hypothetical protein HDU78_005473 [Chytriomyces hyalinus]|nr:hypothetical protein HDU78_005473 [Chytriomyces hyalinus]
MLPLFKYTSSRASPLPPPRSMLASTSPKKRDSNPPNKDIAESLAKMSLKTHNVNSNLQLFPPTAATANAPKLAAQYSTGGTGDGSLLTRERTMEMYRLHPSSTDIWK